MNQLTYDLSVIWACARKEIKSALTERLGTSLGIITPVSCLVLFSLFALNGGLAPIAVVMADTGPLAQEFYQAMAHAHSFRLQTAGAEQAQTLLKTGRIVAVVTIPADFDASLQASQPVQVGVQINNLNTDFTNDIRRAVPLSISSFYAQAFPRLVNVTADEHDLWPQDTDYIPYLTVSILVIALMMGGLLSSGTAAAVEWENATIKELLLSPASRWAIMVGKMLGSFLVGLASTTVVLAVLVVVVWPLHWAEVIGFSLLTLLIFNAYGTLLGTLLKQRQTFIALAFATGLPLFFLSGAFGPVSFANIPLIEFIAKVFPVYYAIVLQQHAFHGFDLNTLGVGVNALVLTGYALALMVAAAISLHRTTESR